MNLRKIYPKRDKWTHKGKQGYVLIISGSKKYSGSPAFNAIASLRAGADLAVIMGPRRAMDIAASFLPDIITFPLQGDCLRKKHLSYIFRVVESKRFNSLVLGCGLGRDEQTMFCVREIIANVNLPMVIDADAIYALCKQREIVYGKRVVLTPHSKEFEVLTGEKVKQDAKDRKMKVKKWAKKLNCVILLKGYIDVISDGQKVVFNKTGSSFMTKGGFGDTLSGILGAILARDISLLQAAQAAAFINGRAGELAANSYGESVLASDIFEFIPRVIKNL